MKYELKVAQGASFRSLAIEAGSVLQARELAEAQGFSVLAVRGVGFSFGALFCANMAGAKFGQSKFNVMLFSQELLALLESGLSLVEAIEALAEKEQQTESKLILNQVKAALFDGLPLSGALALVPQVFSPLYIALIRASEHTGDMAQALARHVTYQTQIDAVRKKLLQRLFTQAFYWWWVAWWCYFCWAM